MIKGKDCQGKLKLESFIVKNIWFTMINSFIKLEEFKIL